MKYFKCEGGYAVLIASDANPDLCKVEIPDGEKAWLYQSVDQMITWEAIGYFPRNDRFGGFDPFPIFLNEIFDASWGV